MPLAACVTWLLLTQASAIEQPQSPRLTELKQALARGETEALPAFWRDVERTHTPLVEPIVGSPSEIWVTFLMRRPRESHAVPSVVGEIGVTTGAVEKRESFPLMALPGSDVWYRTSRLSSRARFSYQLTPPLDVDPLNPKQYTVRWSDAAAPIQTSYVEGPDAPPETELAERAGVRRGTLETFDLPGPSGGNGRRVSIYTPPRSTHGGKEGHLLLLFDAALFLSGIPTPTILDNLQAEGKIGPVIAVFVGDSPTEDRISDLRPTSRLSAFLREELMPWLRQRYRVPRDPRRNVIGGSSLGGLAAAYAALANPDLFANVISLSGSYWWWPGFTASSDPETLLNSESGWLTHEYATASKRPLRFFLNVGTWEGAVMLLPNRSLRDMLEAKGYHVEYREFVGGHDPTGWRSGLVEGLSLLLKAEP